MRHEREPSRNFERPRVALHVGIQHKDIKNIERTCVSKVFTTELQISDLRRTRGGGGLEEGAEQQGFTLLTMKAPVPNSVGIQALPRSFPSIVMEGRVGAFHLNVMYVR